MKSMFLIFLIGKPGSGKDMTGNFLMRHYGEDLYSFHSSCVIRDVAERYKKIDYDKYLEMSNLMRKGILFNYEFVVEEIKKRIEQNKQKKFILINGYPRVRDQFKSFVHDFIDYKKKVFIELVANDEIAKKRCLSRKECTKCKIVPIDNRSQQCESCGSIEFNIRPDDNQEAWITRIKEFRTHSSFYFENRSLFQEHAKIYQLENNSEPENTYKRLIEVLNKLEVDGN